MENKSELETRLEKIEGLKITYSHLYQDKKHQYPYDVWIAVINYKDQFYDTKMHMGSAYRKPISGVEFQRNGYYNKLTGQFKSFIEACDAGWLKITPPNRADVISNLMISSSCGEGTFEDYCSEYGYNTDSRKALDDYLTCQQVRTAMIKMFGRELFNELVRLQH